MSFSLTTEQMCNKSKFVTRRLGWKFLKIGEHIQAVEKCQGLKKGEKVKKICEIYINSVVREPLHIITKGECFLEGFPEMTPHEFIEMFCKANKCKPDTIVTRIKFDYVIDILRKSDGLFGYMGTPDL